MSDLKQINNKHKNYFNLTSDDLKKLNKLFFEWDSELKNKNKIGFDGIFRIAVSKNNKFISKPPWGKITSVDMTNGSIDWQIPFGYEDNKNIGVPNVGGLSISSSNLIFANGTTDSYAFIFDGNTGKELWKFKMKVDGSTPPLIYEYKNKQYVSFLATGNWLKDDKKGSSLYTFSLK